MAEIDTIGEYWLVCIILVFLLLALILPYYYLFRPSPKSYLDFIRDTWGVRARDKNGGVMFRWMSHYWAAVGISFFIGQAVHSTLHYPLMVKLDANVFQIGVLDAASSFLATVLDGLLRSRRGGFLRSLSRSKAFLVAGLLNLVSYAGIIGVGLPLLDGTWGLFAIFISQTLTGLHLTFQEYSVMRNDWNEDVVSSMKTQRGKSAGLENSIQRWRNSEETGLKLGQLFVVCRYPATIIANLIFGPFVYSKTKLEDAYIVLGLFSAAHGIWLAWAWKGHSPDKPTKTPPEDSALLEDAAKPLVNVPLDDLWPGGTYFSMALGVAFYNAVLDVTRKGYVRLLNLQVLKNTEIDDSDLHILVTITFAISFSFFWLADSASNAVPEYAQLAYRRMKSVTAQDSNSSLTPKMLLGLISFALMSLGHLFMGLTSDFYGLLVSSVFFGLGQAASTGLRTSIKDDVRLLLRDHNQEENYRKRFMRILNGVATVFTIVSSLIVGSFGRDGLDRASLFYAAVALVGGGLALFEAFNLRKVSEHRKSARMVSQPEDDLADK